MDIRQVAEEYMDLCIEKRKIEGKIYDRKLEVIKVLMERGDIHLLDVNWGRLCRVERITPLKYRDK